MDRYHFTVKCKDASPEKIWEFIQNGLSNDVIIKSIKDKVPYNINYITESEISFSVKTRNDGKPEIITLEDFIRIIIGLMKMETFNTSTSKPIFRESKVYRKRSPMFALLVSSGVIEKTLKTHQL
ncbi:hypothetical protein FYC62_02670 [Pedobacter aquae]|uniref:Uncharacterized protein n=1 Tax=Pedobacter aquae TaxID=2605747 RepID=A0A5C0VF12_9SPHI|nr:hypothetical protein [Pedobacter aquae]QEK50689.1 hypothetical protein FYC62_02670 [Pedobacter aquae]